jgi:YHS domain-containing protein
MKETDLSNSVGDIAALMIKYAALVIVCALALPLYAQDDAISWLDDIQQAQRQAAAEDKLVLVHFWGSFCRPCINVEKFVFTNPRVATAITDAYVPVKVDVESNPKLAKQFGVTTIPHDIVITPAGHVVAKQASSTNSDGYMRMLQSVAAKAGRTNPVSLEAVQQIAQSVPEGDATVNNAFVPVGQSSVTPEPLQNIGPAAQPLDQQIRTVAGELMAPTPPDERKLPSATPPQFADQIRRDQPIDSYPTVPVEPPSQETDPNLPAHAKSQILRPMRAPLPQSVALPDLGKSTAYPNGQAQMQTPLGTSGENQLPRQVAGTISPNSGLPLTVKNPTATDAKINSELPLGFNGACPATWHATGQFVPGHAQWGCEHRGRVYLFASRELRDQFQLTPDVLSPALAGYDPVTYALTGDLQDGCLEHFVETGVNGTKSIYLFATAENKATFEINPQKYIDEVRQAMQIADQAPAGR